jgi:hypothetical protein
MRRVFLARVTSAQMPLVSRIVQMSFKKGAAQWWGWGLGPRWVLAHGCATSRDEATQ